MGDTVHVYDATQLQTLTNSHRELLQGTALGDSCTFNGLLDGSTNLTVQELAYDPSRCLSLVEIGTPTTGLPISPPEAAAAEPASWTVDGDPIPSIPATLETDPDWSPDAADYTESTGSIPTDASPEIVGTVGDPLALIDSAQKRPVHHVLNGHSWLQDPPGIHVNDVTATIDYFSLPNCATAPGTWVTHTVQWVWFKTTGWQLKEHPWAHSANCSGVTTTATKAHFHNRLFCAAVSPILAFFPTEVYHQPTSITGYWNGTYSGSFYYTKSGPCSYLLNYHYEVTTGDAKT